MPPLATWRQAAADFGIANPANEGEKAFDQMAAAINDDAYVQSTFGVLPEALVTLYELEQARETAGSYPLSRANPASRYAPGEIKTQKGLSKTIMARLEASALDKAKSMGGELQVALGKKGKPVTDLEARAVSGYLASLLMTLGGLGLRESGIKSGGVAKNIMSLLQKTPLNKEFQDELPASVRPYLLKTSESDIYDKLVRDSLSWFNDFAQNEANPIIDQARKKTALKKKIEQKDISATVLEEKSFKDDKKVELSIKEWLERVLKGGRDEFAEEQLIEQGGNLSPEDPGKGARSGMATSKTTTSKAIPFETRSPSTHMDPSKVPEYAREVIAKLNRVHDVEPVVVAALEDVLALMADGEMVAAGNVYLEAHATIKTNGLEKAPRVVALVNRIDNW